MTTETETDSAKAQARAQLDSILEMVRDLDTNDDDKREAAIVAIQEDPLSVLVRGDWREVGAKNVDGEFEILLCTGGPAVRVIGELDHYQQPQKPRLQYQDWGTSWIEFFDMSSPEREALQTYCEQFYFGE